MDNAAEFDGASIDTIRSHFQAWVEAQGKRDRFPKYSMCMAINGQCLQALTDAAPFGKDEDKEYDQLRERYVKVVEAWPQIDQFDTFQGWMKCSVFTLFDL
jgi:hypothetical protein